MANEGYVEYTSDSGSDSIESDEKRKSYKAKPQSKTQGKHSKKTEGNTNKRKKAEKKTKPKKKKCKTERRDNMLCTICYNPISDEKSESCSYSSEPKEHNYAYSEDSNYGGNKNKKEPESLERDESYDESDNVSEGQTIKPERKNPPSNKYPVYNSRKPKQAGQYKTSPRPQTHRKYGPQTFDIPQNFRVAQARGRPSQYKTKKAAPVTLLRYRTVENPFTSERIRLIVPAGPQNHPKKKPLKNANRLPPTPPPDVRPPRDVNNGGAQTESLLSNVTKLSEFEYLPSHLNDEASRHSVTFTNKDGLKCRKSSDGNKVCFECFVDGERRKECMFSKTHKPTRFFESYTTSKKSKHSLGSLNPLNFDSTPALKPAPKPAPKAKHVQTQHKGKPKSHSPKQTKNKKHVKTDEESSFFPISEEVGFAHVEKVPAETEADWSLNPKSKQKQNLKPNLKQNLKQAETEADWSLSPKNKQKQNLKQNPKKPETEADWSLNPINKHNKQLDTVIEWNVNQNNQQKPIKSQPLRAVPEVIYGTPQPAQESYTVYYEPKPIQFIADTSSRTIHVK